MDRASIAKIDLGQAKYIYIKVSWEHDTNNLFNILIFHNSEQWLGGFSYESLKAETMRLEETEEQYTQDIKNCLTKQNSMYKYEFTIRNEKVAKFSWKKRFENSTAVMLHGSVEIFLSPNQGKDSLINYLLDKNLALEKMLEESYKSNKQLNDDIEKYKKEFEKLIDDKHSLEKTLYGKFVQVLNAKKRRIQLLEDHLKDTD